MIKSLLLVAAVSISGAVSAQLSFSNGNAALLNDPGYISSHPIAVMDMDGDKKDDLVILDDGEILYVHYQTTPGALFTSYAYPSTISSSSAWGMCGGDIDGNGFSDILYGGAYDDIHLVTNNGMASNYTATDLGHSIFVQGINFGDIDNDGNLDIFACHDDGPGLVLIGDGLGGFTQSSANIDTNLPNGSDNSGNYGSVFTDFDNDGDVDLYVAKCRQGVSDPNDFRRINILFVNDGNGNYTEAAAVAGIASGEQSWSADFADVDNDGDMDLYLGQHSSDSQLFTNNGDGTFTETSAASGIAGGSVNYVIQSIFEDFDNDGWIDLLVTGGNDYTFFMNNGDGTFDYSVQPQIHDINSFALGDLNSDGFTDFYSTPEGYGSWGGSGADTLYLNDGNSNNYLTVTLEGTVSNLEGIGARVEIYGPWGVQVREIRSGASYGIQNSLNAHFGLGMESTVDSVCVRWPSGIKDLIPNVPGNQFFHVIEGDNSVGLDEYMAEMEMVLFPNPTVSDLIIRTNSEVIGAVYNIYSVDGALVASGNITSTHESINVSNLSTGEYQVVLSNKSAILSSKSFVKK